LEVSKAHAEDADKSEEVESMSMAGGNFAEQHCDQKGRFPDNYEKVNKMILSPANTVGVDARTF
jgi:hypothetical protein